jgi:two-component system, NtrC family, sensor kinase
MKTILIIEDDSFLREAIQERLRAKGYATLEAGSGNAGLELARKYAPDLILSDICMEQGDGFMLLESLRKETLTATTPVILMTGNSSEMGLSRSMEMGADDYITKPFTLDALVARVEARLKKQADLLRQSEQAQSRLQAILEATTDLVMITDIRHETVCYLNRAGRDLLELGREDVSRLTLDQWYPSWAGALIQQEGIPAALQQGVWSGETAFLNRSGKEIPVSHLILAHRDGEGNVEFFSTIARDISRAKEAEQALRRSEELFRIITENRTELIALVDSKGNRLYNSPSYQAVLGYTPEELQATSSLDQIHPEDHSKVMAASGEAWRTGVGGVLEYRMRHKDGSWKILESHAGVIRNAQGEMQHLLIVARDITERKRAETEREQMEVQLRHAQKMESIGQLAAGIAHEINTPTQYLGDNIQFLKEGFADLNCVLRHYEELWRAAKEQRLTPDLLSQVEEAVQKHDAPYLMTEIPRAIAQSQEGVQRVTQIIGAMKEFSHPGAADKTPTDLNQAILSTISVARHEWKYVAEMVTDLDPELPLVPCLPGEFNQVILNLIVNAAHAISEPGASGGPKGVITISTRVSGEWAEVCIRDTGSGIPEKIREKIFIPFFTTKPIGIGTGQGLALAHGVIVDKLKGEIRFETELGKGTAFFVRLPLAPLPPQKPDSP